MLKDLLFKLTAVLLMVSMTNLANGQGMSCDMAEVITAGTYTLSEDIPSNGTNTNPATTDNGGVADGAVWYSYTPTEDGVLGINSCLGGADTRLWVYTGDCTTGLVPYVNNDDACLYDAAITNQAWASALENVAVAAGTTYIIEWDNNWSSDAFTFNVDFTPLPAVDVIAAGDALPYTRYPDTQAAVGLPISGIIGNGGVSALTGAVLTAEVYTTSDLDTPIWTMASDAMDLATGDVVAVDFGTWTPMTQDDYIIAYTATATEEEAEAEQANNLDFSVITVKKTYSRDAAPNSLLGVNGGEVTQGQVFEFPAEDTVSTATLYYEGGIDGDVVELVIYDVDAMSGAPVSLISSQVIPNGQGWITVVLDEEFAVEAGSSYYFGVHSITAGEGNILLGTDTQNFTPNSMFIDLGAGLVPIESLQDGAFSRSYSVRINMKGDAMYNLTVSVDMSNETVAAAGVFLAGNFNGWDASVNMMTDVGEGVYTATVSVPQNTVPEYKFVNGGDTWEDVPAECALAPDTEFLNRFANVLTFDFTAAPVCFSLCTSCPIIQEPCTNPDAVICDNFDTYDLGDISAQSDIWEPWPMATGATVSSDQAQSGTNSMLVSAAEGADQILLFPANVTAGNFTARWSYYVPAGTSAYFNLQGDQDNIGGTFKMECVFAGDGTGTLFATGAEIAFTYPEDQWFDITHFIDFDNDWIQLVIDGAPVHQWMVSDDSDAAGGTAQIGAVNFFPNSAASAFYVDDLEIVAVPSCADASIICDPMESYFIGASGPQSTWWSTWSGTEGGDEDGEVSLDYSNGGEKSLKLTGGGSQDVILLLGNQTEGRYRISMDMYIEGTNTGYYNIQEDETPAVQWNVEVFANGDGTGNMVAAMEDIGTFDYSADAWNNFENIIDLDNGTMIINVNGVEAYNGDYIGAQIGSINFYPADAAAVFYVDNINFSELEPIMVEPTPVAVTMTVLTSNITVDAGGMLIAGSFSGWNDVAMTDDGNDSWSYTATVNSNEQIQYKFKNGPEGWEETPGGDCVTGDNNDRFLDVADVDVTVDAVCFATCEASCPSNTIDAAFDAAFAVSPNPTKGMFTVSYNMEVAADLNIRVTNMLGQLVATRTVDSALAGTESFDLTDMPAGTYTLVTTAGERMSTKRIILQ